MVNSWAFGAIINVVGSIFINLGTNVMKLGHNKRAASPLPEKERPAVRRIREWQAGVAMFAVGNILNFVSFAFAAQSLLAALGSVQFVSNVFFAYFVLHEKSNKRVVLATALIVCGCIVLVTFGNHHSKALTAQQLQEYYKSRVYITYLVLLLVTVVITYIIYRIGKAKLAAHGQANLSRRWTKLLPISFALFSGMLGTQSVLFSKALSTLLRTTFDGDSQLDTWFFYVLLLLFICTAAFWVSRLNKALKLFPAVVIVPTMQISWTLFSILSGGIYYQEYKGYNTLKSVMFAVGVVIAFHGVYLLTPEPEGYHLRPRSPPRGRSAAGRTAAQALAQALGSPRGLRALDDAVRGPFQPLLPLMGGAGKAEPLAEALTPKGEPSSGIHVRNPAPPKRADSIV